MGRGYRCHDDGGSGLSSKFLSTLPTFSSPLVVKMLSYASHQDSDSWRRRQMATLVVYAAGGGGSGTTGLQNIDKAWASEPWHSVAVEYTLRWFGSREPPPRLLVIPDVNIDINIDINIV